MKDLIIEDFPMSEIEFVRQYLAAEGLRIQTKKECALWNQKAADLLV